MKILVTGADGQLGMSFRKVAAECPQHEFVFAGHGDCDITSHESVAACLDGIDAVVNCAAYTAVDKAETEPDVARAVNVLGTEVVAEEACRHGAVMVHVSTDYVFDGHGSRPYGENDVPSPLNVYGRTKLEGEKAVRNSGVRAVIVRTAWLYSEFGHNFVKTMMRMAREGYSPGVVDDQHGTPTYAVGLARAVVQLLENGVDGCEVYNYTDDGEATWYEFAAEIFRIAGASGVVRSVGSSEYRTVARRPAYSVLDKSKIKAVGIALRPWQEQLQECMSVLLAGEGC